MIGITYENNLDFARKMDAEDPLGRYRDQFNLPTQKNNKQCLYFCGNSLGLQPKGLKIHIDKELERWKELGVDGWFDKEDPWLTYQDTLARSMAELVGAFPEEIAVMNSLTVNLHLMMASFYRPNNKRYKILMESDAFPSDRYAIESQLALHGFDPSKGIIEISPSSNGLLDTSLILELIEEKGEEIALVLLGGVNYYTGQFLEIESITRIAKKKGCIIGWDLAHAAGNVILELHKHEVDFAVWCNYKYINSGPGSIAACFVHKKHHMEEAIPRLSGWWGQSLEKRFTMRDSWKPETGANGWVISTPSILGLACIRASLNLFAQVGITALRKKSVLLTGYLEYIMKEMGTERIRIITPSNPEERGAQLSIRVIGSDKSLFDSLSREGVIVDWREPEVIRVAPAPFYNSYEEVFKLGEILRKLVGEDGKLNQ